MENLIKIFKAVDDFMNRFDLFDERPEFKYMVFNFFIQKLTSNLSKVAPHKLDSLFREKFTADSRANIPLLAFSFGMMNHFRNALAQAQKQINELQKLKT